MELALSAAQAPPGMALVITRRLDPDRDRGLGYHPLDVKLKALEDLAPCD
jgi:hypothetical protein